MKAGVVVALLSLWGAWLPSLAGEEAPASKHWSTLSGQFDVAVKVWSRPLHHPDIYRGRAVSAPVADARRLAQTITMEPGRTGLGTIAGSLALEGEGGRITGAWGRGDARLHLEGRLSPGARTVVLRGRAGHPAAPANLVDYEVDWRILGGGGHLFTAYIKVPSVGRVRFAEARLTTRVPAPPSKEEAPP
jgi:hypothetical protein